MDSFEILPPITRKSDISASLFRSLLPGESLVFFIIFFCFYVSDSNFIFKLKCMGRFLSETSKQKVMKHIRDLTEMEKS